MALPLPLLLSLLLLLLLATALGSPPACDPTGAPQERPVVGLLTQPLSPGDPREILVASYVKWVEAAGARAVPLRYTDGAQALLEQVMQVNGVLFPGGNADIDNGTYAAAARQVFAAVLAENQAGRPLPFWGTCLGFEQMALYSSGGAAYSQVLSAVDAEDIFVPVQWLDAALDGSSWLLRGAAPGLFAELSGQNVTVNMHQWGVMWDQWGSGALPQALTSQYRPLATSADRQGRVFVALMEHAQYPIAGFQAHAEKNVYEWSQGHPDYVHAPAAVAAMQFLASSFVDQCRQNTRSFASEAALEASLIYNYPPTFTGVDQHVEQTYFFS